MKKKNINNFQIGFGQNFVGTFTQILTDVSSALFQDCLLKTLNL